MSHAEDLSDELIPLLRGELSRERTRVVVNHLLGCPICSRELVEAVDIHAALMNARVMLDVRGKEPATEREAPEQAQGPAVLSVVPDEDWSAPDDVTTTDALPPLRAPRRRSGPARYRGRLAIAAAILVAVGAGGVVADRTLGQPDPTRSVALQPVTGSGEGSVTMRGPGDRTTMTIDTARLQPPTSGHFYYAWLLDPKTQKMLPLGVVNADASSTFSVPTELVGRYGAVDISLQDDNGDPSHSATSVLRAQY